MHHDSIGAEREERRRALRIPGDDRVKLPTVALQQSRHLVRGACVPAGRIDQYGNLLTPLYLRQVSEERIADVLVEQRIWRDIIEIQIVVVLCEEPHPSTKHP